MPLDAEKAAGQQIAAPPTGGLKLGQQRVPQRLPRPAGAPQDWQPNQDPQTVPSFIETLKGNDASIEVVVGQGRLLTTRRDIATRDAGALIAVGDPTVIDFEVLPNARMIRITGKRAGVTDLSITTADGQSYSFEVHVVYDLPLLGAQLMQIFPEARLRLGQIREHLVVEGEARSISEVTQIMETLQAYLDSVQVERKVQGTQPTGTPGQEPDRQARPANGRTPPVAGPPNGAPAPDEAAAAYGPSAAPETDRPSVEGQFVAPRIINLIRVPGVQQVSLQVSIAELNRTAMREIGADILGVDPSTGNILGTNIGGATVDAMATLGLGGLVGLASGANNPMSTTAFGIFPSSDWQILLRALRSNELLRILAEPTLVSMSGQSASFLAGGEFPIPVPQGGGGLNNNVTIQFREFGIRLDFIPYVLDHETIRLTVTPEASTIDESLGTTLVVGGEPVPGLNTRRATTTVELREGQTLAIAGLLQVTTEASTDRIPGLGDLPYIGPLFSNTSHAQTEKELLVLVTPHLIHPMEHHEVPPLPGEEIMEPNDMEFYLMNRIEGRTGQPFRSTTAWDDPLGLVRLMKLEKQCISGPVGFSE